MVDRLDLPILAFPAQRFQLPAQEKDLLPHVQNDLRPGQVHAKLRGQTSNPQYPLDVPFRVAERAALTPRRDETELLVAADGGRGNAAPSRQNRDGEPLTGLPRPPTSITKLGGDRIILPTHISACLVSDPGAV